MLFILSFNTFILSFNTFILSFISADTFSADTISSDTFSADTFSSDTFSADTISSDTFSSDTFSSDTFSSDTFSVSNSSFRVLSFSFNNDICLSSWLIAVFNVPFVPSIVSILFDIKMLKRLLNSSIESFPSSCLSLFIIPCNLFFVVSSSFEGSMSSPRFSAEPEASCFITYKFSP